MPGLSTLTKDELMVRYVEEVKFLNEVIKSQEQENQKLRDELRHLRNKIAYKCIDGECDKP